MISNSCICSISVSDFDKHMHITYICMYQPVSNVSMYIKHRRDNVQYAGNSMGVLSSTSGSKSSCMDSSYKCLRLFEYLYITTVVSQQKSLNTKTIYFYLKSSSHFRKTSKCRSLLNNLNQWTARSKVSGTLNYLNYFPLLPT